MDSRRNCSICSIESGMICSRCKLASYCSIEHQKEDWPNHKKVCFPLKLTFITDRNRNHYVAKSDIKEGKITHVQRKLMIFPIVTNSTELKFPENNGNVHNQSRAKVCISCCQELSADNIKNCFKCKWPVCNENCANDEYHKKLECNILAKNRIIFRNDPIIYTKNAVLRALLLKQVYPEKWEQFLKLKLTNDNMEWVNGHGKAICNYIIVNCNLKEFDESTVIRVFQTLEDNLTGDYRTKCAATLDVMFANVAEGCLPNVTNFYGTKCENPKATAIEKFDRYYYALREIKKGEMLINGIHELQRISGTVERRETLKEKFKYLCTCKMCEDPTELKTFFSAVKCKACNNGKPTSNDPNLGHILMVNPLQKHSVWKCNYCSKIVEAEIISKLILKMTSEAHREEIEIHQQFVIRVLSIENDRKDVYSAEMSTALGTALIADIRKFCQTLKIAITEMTQHLHPNHYLILNKKFCYLFMLFTMLNFNSQHQFLLDELYLVKRIWKINCEGSFDCSEAFPDWIQLNEEVVRISLEILEIMQTFQTDTSYSFGRLYYFLTFSKLVILKHEARKHKDFKIFLADLHAWKCYKHKVENIFSKAIDIENTDAYMNCLKKMDEIDHPDRNDNNEAIFESICRM